ncbi:MAG: carboxypeptidase-like regulatory domain-containing protein [Nanoarchaeota archaeon]|nr:carboxypeptidase-like regulatory domain-containing protein [Nanoarchaeota archaeon]
MKKGREVIGFIFLVIAIIGITSYFAISAPCDPENDLDLCYNQFLLSSDAGFGAAEICGECYKCGAADGVCPELFKNGTEPEIGNCSRCNDPDCNATIYGFVYEASDICPPGICGGIDRAKVTVVPQNPTVPSAETITEPDGSYILEGVPTGWVAISASKIGYDTYINETILTAGDNTEFDFYLPNASCDENCADYFGRCNMDCEGINGCEFNTDPATGFPGIDILCHQRRFGESVIYEQTDTDTTVVECCRGDGSSVESRPPAQPRGEMPNLLQTEIPVIYNGRAAVLVIAVW